MVQIEYVESGMELIDEVGPLWEKLNIHHRDKSINFKERYKKFKFETRKNGFVEKAKTADFHIVLARDINTNSYAGYCVSSVSDNKTGEIESLYLDENYRKLKIGETLMEKSIDWIKNREAKSIIIGVAAGNEDVFNFYKRFGFYPKVTILEQITE